MKRVFFNSLLVAILVSHVVSFNNSSVPVLKKPSCWIESSYPPRMSVMTLTSGQPNQEIYEAYYCYPLKASGWCLDKETGYKKINCTVNIKKGGLLECNMTMLVRKLYPNLVDINQSAVQLGYQLCMVFSAKNSFGTTYSKIRCCSVVKINALRQVKNFQAKVTKKRQVDLSWRSPYSNEALNANLRYNISLSSDFDNYATKKQIIIKYSSRQDRLSFNHSYTVRNLHPYTRYKVSASIYVGSTGKGPPSRTIEFHTLEEAPSSPPKLIDVQTSRNQTGKSVHIEWQHPRKEDRNGVISKTVIEYEERVNLSNRALPSGYTNISVPANQTMIVITALDPAANYSMWLRSCTVECSNRSDVYIIKGFPPKSSKTSRRSSESIYGVLVSVLVVLACILVGIISFLVYRHYSISNNNNDQPPLPPDIIRVIHSNDSTSDDSCGHVVNEYAHASFVLSTPTNDSEAAILNDTSACQATSNRQESSEDIPLF